LFYCDLDQYEFRVWKNETGYSFRMTDISGNPILLEVNVEEEIYYADSKKREYFTLISDLYELARRKALELPDKLSKVEALLDSI
jgi:hypothetical protein